MNRLSLYRNPSIILTLLAIFLCVILGYFSTIYPEIEVFIAKTSITLLVLVVLYSIIRWVISEHHVHKDEK